MRAAEDENDDKPTAEIKPAHFPVELGLPPADESFLADAKAAIRQEFRDSSKWKKLQCRKVSIIAERERGTVYAVQVGSSVDFDWTWEGATAFRPSSLDDSEYIDLADFEESLVEEASLWSGEILEVDERNGCLFISLTDPERPPVVGSFFVRPFEFLGVLDAVYHESRFDEIRKEIPSRLAATKGGIHPVVAQPSPIGDSSLSEWWGHTWSVLWGPPGTGKTTTTGRQVVAAMSDPTERILVISTTNRATDAAALSIGKAAQVNGKELLDDGQLLRIGKGASFQEFRGKELQNMLHGTESEVLSQIDDLAKQLPLFEAGEDRALTRKQIGQLRAKSKDQSKRIFVDPAVRVVVATAFKAMSFLNDETVRKIIENGEAPFTTIFIDEAGLMSRAAIAVLSLLASRRVVLVGDSKQLAPISRILRILPTRQQTWLANSGVSHLKHTNATPKAVHVLSQQHRMHPDVCKVVSDYQYDGILTTAPNVEKRESQLPSLLNESRAIWYVLDEEDADLSSIRAERGPGNRSWVRSITTSILAKLFSDESMRNSSGLFISPYKAQAQVVSKWFASWGITSWEASTVHSQQGSEKDVVIFDTVNAGSYNWPPDEWQRLVNVAISRAKEAVIVLASRSEMEEPYLLPLTKVLSPYVLIKHGRELRWEKVDAIRPSSKPVVSGNGDKIGDQIAQRKTTTPVLSQEQQRLSNLELDGKPRLVRGVAGSGKSVVLANWLAKTVKRTPNEEERSIWAVYANRSLHKLLQNCIESAWQSSNSGKSFPWKGVSLLHVKDVLAHLLPSVSLSMDDFDFDYDAAAEEFLNRQDAASLLPRCKALFIDEAQDMGPSTLKLLLSLVEKSDAEDDNSRSAHIFFDNAQNIYGRGTPKWSEFGLDMRGRSTILKESFRSTVPITELAVNVLYRLTPISELPDHKELLSLGLIERTTRKGEDWFKVRFSQIQGRKPRYRSYPNRAAEMTAIGDLLKHLITVDGVSPADIVLIYNGKTAVKVLEEKLAPRMTEIGVELSVQTNRPFERQPNTLLVTTSHSYKGYDAEVVLIPCADLYTAGDNQVLPANLYVAMTRARSLLAIYSVDGYDAASRRVTDAIRHCVDVLESPPDIDADVSKQDDFNDILEQIGHEHRKWLASLFEQFEIIQERIFDRGGEAIAEPLFWIVKDGRKFACFGNDGPSEELQGRLDKVGVAMLKVGE